MIGLLHLSRLSSFWRKIRPPEPFPAACKAFSNSAEGGGAFLSGRRLSTQSLVAESLTPERDLWSKWRTSFILFLRPDGTVKGGGWIGERVSFFRTLSTCRTATPLTEGCQSMVGMAAAMV